MVPLNKNPIQIGQMFSALAGRYDRANRWLSFFQDQRWRKAVVRWADLKMGDRVLDLCTGTGDLALEFARSADVQVTGADISAEMLALAGKKARGSAYPQRLRFEAANVMELPYAEGAFDVVSVAFGLRNLPDYRAGLTQMYRVLKPGGQLLILEFSQPQGMWGKLYLRYLRSVLPVLGGWITGQQAPYRYLDESIRRFPGRNDLAELMAAVGFERTACRSLSGGIALIHRGIKP